MGWLVKIYDLVTYVRVKYAASYLENCFKLLTWRKAVVLVVNTIRRKCSEENIRLFSYHNICQALSGLENLQDYFLVFFTEDYGEEENLSKL